MKPSTVGYLEVNRSTQSLSMPEPQQLNNSIVSFYRGEAPNISGYTIQEIWAWDVERLECVHDYIQWLFSLSDRSAFNDRAPIVNENIILAFHNDPQLQQNLRRSFELMLQFYGLKRQHESDGKITIDRSIDYPIRKQEWICLFDHNYLRITRILKCLTILGLPDEALAFYRCLERIYQEESDRIGGETFQYWKNAVS
jgi:Opioid growth factor receptor (OGFr) conserved region